MSRYNTSSPPAGQWVGPFLSGFALSLGLVVAFHWFGVGPLPAAVAAGAATALVLLGCSIGVRAASAVRGVPALRWFTLIAVLLLWCWWAWTTEVDGWIAALAGVAGAALLAALAVGPHGRNRSGFIAGVALGLLACALGLPALLGLPAMAVSCAVGVAAARLLTGPAGGASTEEASGGGASTVLLGAAAGMAGTVLLRNYLLAVHSLGYGLADLGAAFALGVLINPRWRSGPSTAGGVACVSALGIGLVATVNTYSLAFFPDLIVSGSGAMQVSPYLLVAGRFFPFWVLALVMGVLCAPLWQGGAGSMVGAAAGAAGAALLPGSLAAPCLIVLALCLATTLTRLRPPRPVTAGHVVRLGGPLLIVAAIVWATAADPHAGWTGLQTAPSVPGADGKRAPGRGAAVKRAETNAWGAWVELRTGPESADGTAAYARFANGGLVERSDPTENVRPPAARLLVALALAYGQEGARVAVVEPALRQTIEGVDALTGGARLETVDPACPPQPERGGVLICGPGPFCAAGNPMRVLSVEGLGRLRKHLGGDGVLALWFPAGNVEWETLRRGLATFSRIFPKFDVWLAGSEAVFVASGGDRMAFRRMETLFGDPAGGHWLRRGGFWEPIEMLVAFTARSEELSGLWEETPVYRLSRPVRPPTLARDLLAQVRPENLAVLAQHKLAGPARVADRLLFTSDNRREVALRGLAAVYRGNTEQILRALGRSGERGRSTLVEFVTGPYARLDFLAPDRQGRAARVAGALTAFGLTGRAIDILEEAVQSGEDTFEARMQLVEALTRARRPQDGLQHCRRALELRPASVSAMRRLAALLMGTGRIREGADALAKVVEQNPRSVVDLLMLAELRARMGSLEEAADLARRALELDPDNTDAQVLLQLTRRAGDDRPRRPGTGGAR